MALTKITTSLVAVNSLTAANIADNSIDATKIANNQILARHIPNATALTLDGGLTVDNITIDGTEVDLSSGDLTFDVAGNIRLDADDNGEVRFLDGGTQYAAIKKDGNHALFQSIVADGDFIIQGIDGSSFVSAVTFDMSDSGAALFNGNIALAGGADRRIQLSNSGTSGVDFSSNNTCNIRGDNDFIKINAAANGGIISEVNGTEYFRIAAGQVDVKSADLTMQDSRSLYFGAGNDLRIHHDGSDSYIKEQGTGNLLIQGSDIYMGDGTDHFLTIRANGKVGIGTTSPSNVLHTLGSITIEGSQQSATDNAWTYYKNADRTWLVGIRGSLNDVFSIYDLTADAQRFSLDTSGYLKIPGVYSHSGSGGSTVVVDSSGNIYRSTSARKYKKNIRDLESIDISLFNPVRFNSNIEGKNQETEYIGFIADDVHDTGITELVVYDDKGEIEGFSYDKMTAVLTKAIQEQQTIIDDLKARIEKLEDA